MAGYQESAREFEPKWQRYWRENETYRTLNPGEPGFDAAKPKRVILDMFPYPSGTGLHIGHPLGYIATDVVARFERMRGKNVLHAMGFDAFGLPAEQFAVQTNRHPRKTTEDNIANMLRQLGVIGLGHDPARRFNTTDPDYYKWTQWIFLRLFDSFYDPTLVWTAPDGKQVTGRARPITELKPLLENGVWLLDEDGVPAPPDSPGGAGRRCQAGELDAAIDRGRLAVIDEVPVNWCPMLGSVLSNEEVTNEGKSERGDFPVYKRNLKQWVLRITAYAPRLLADLDGLDWPGGIIGMQRDWIGRSEGARVEFSATAADGSGHAIAVYTTRPDTLFGATYMVLAPDHPLVDVLCAEDQKQALAAYRRQAAGMKAVAAKEEATREKTGVALGITATNPCTGEEIPVWVANYVLMGYGTGAIMAVPSGDCRDFEFAVTFGLPVRATIAPPETWLKDHAPDGLRGDLLSAYIADPKAFGDAFTGDGACINSANDEVSLDGLSVTEAKRRIIGWLQEKGLGTGKTQYKLRDWLFSRQRYWGEPFPVVFEQATGRVRKLTEDQLPVLLPEMTDFKPKAVENPDSDPEPPLARAGDWLTLHGIVLDDGSVRPVSAAPGDQVDGKPVQRFRRDVNSMPNWAGSCWYYLRYFDAGNKDAMVGKEAEAYWACGTNEDGTMAAGAVDLYVGGAEHAVLHLLYSRFWHKVLFDLGHVSTREPFRKLFNQGMITADAYRDGRGVYVDIHDVEIRDLDGRKTPVCTSTGEALETVPGKMGKRYKNGLPPEEICADYTIDTFRAYEMYMGPLDASKPWQSEAIIGMMRFFASVWRICTGMEHTDTVDQAINRLVHKTVAKVTEDFAGLRINTALAAMIELSNALSKQPAVHPDHIKCLALLVAPVAPHLGEELISRIAPAEFAVKKSVIHFDWPDFEADKLIDSVVEVPVQVNGKRRAAITVAADTTKEQLQQLGMAEENVARHIKGKQIVRVIPVFAQDKPKLLNIVVKG